MTDVYMYDQINPNYIREAKIFPIKNQVYSPNMPNDVREQMFTQLRMGFTDKPLPHCDQVPSACFWWSREWGVPRGRVLASVCSSQIPSESIWK